LPGKAKLYRLPEPDPDYGSGVSFCRPPVARAFPWLRRALVCGFLLAFAPATSACADKAGRDYRQCEAFAKSGNLTEGIRFCELVANQYPGDVAFNAARIVTLLKKEDEMKKDLASLRGEVRGIEEQLAPMKRAEANHARAEDGGVNAAASPYGSARGVSSAPAPNASVPKQGPAKPAGSAP
jgi:hypothetical protein